MFFVQILIIFFCYSFFSSAALQCITKCTISSDFTTPFSIPVRCQEIVSAGKCLAYLTFWFNRDQYDVIFTHAVLSTAVYQVNKRYAIMEIPATNSSFFVYDITYTCNDKDNCTQDLITDAVNEILKRKLNYRRIADELTPLTTGPPLSPTNSHLNCYGSKENVLQCATMNKPGWCFVSDHLIKERLTRSCYNGTSAGGAFVGIYQSETDVRFELRCNRSLCNEPSTLQTAKEIMFKYNVTKTEDGHLYNHSSRIILSVTLIVTLLFHLI